MKKVAVQIVLLFFILVLSSFCIGLQIIKLDINWDGDSKKNDFITIDQKHKETLKDGTKLQFFALTFFNDSKKLETISININGFEKESDWDAESPFEIDSTQKKNSLVLIHNGFPACGYGQNYFLFAKNEGNKIQLVDQWETYFDAPYGTYHIFKPINESSFARILVSIGGSDKEMKDGEEELAMVTKSDSVLFYQEKNKWIKKQITPKNKDYWKKEMSFDDAYNTKF